MTRPSKWRSHFEENKTLFIILAVGLFLVELEIFAMAAIKSGQESRVQIWDQQNNLLFQSSASKLDPGEKREFESTFGPLSDYQVKLVTVQRPFPFRAWFAGAVGLPIGAVLLFGFFIKAYESLFFRNEEPANSPAPPDLGQTDRLERVLLRIRRLNIFVIGGLVLLLALGLFAVPHLLSEFGRHTVAVISKYHWIALGVCGVFLALVLWIIFLRYLLARKAIETQADVEKYRLQLEMTVKREAAAQLPDLERPQLQLSQDDASQSLLRDKQ
jgi:hypothetical protein